MIDPPSLPPDPRPGVAVTVYYRKMPPKMTTWRVQPTLNDNDRVSLPPELRSQQSVTCEFWPLTANGMMLYHLWRTYGLRALCVPMNP